MRLCVESGRGAGAGPAPQGLLLRAQPLAGAAGAVLMAALGDEVLDGSTYRACAGHSYPYTYLPPAKDKGLAGGGGRRHRGGGYPPASSPSSAGAAPSSFPGCGQLMAAEYLDSYQRAQLMALLAQVGPGLGRLPRGAGSRDVAVQVNPRRDVSVQCSLGRRTLPRRARALGGPAGPGPDGTAGAGGGLASPQPARPGLEQGTRESSTPRPMRFPRTVAVYSRRLTTFLEGAEAAAGEQGPVPRDGEPGPPPARSRGPAQGAGSARTAPQRPQSEAEEAEARIAVRTSWERPVDGQREGEAALRRAPRSPKQPQSAARVQDGEGDRSSPRSPEPYKERLRFQFLEQKYGYYHCKECNIRWESAYVWCVQGTNKVYFKQFCRTCQKSYNPYRVEGITCQSCKQTRCSCSVKLRHVDPKRPHRQDLCGRCKGKRLSCDSTFSFKYII